MKKFNLIVPDIGASKKTNIVASYLTIKGLEFNQIYCDKERNLKTGEIIKTLIHCNDLQNLPNIIIDDIGDGCKSFIELAKAMKDIKGCNKIYLVLTHGIFSKGLKELSEYFDGIYTTNSYRDINSMNEFGMHNEKYLDKIKQLNVF